MKRGGLLYFRLMVNHGISSIYPMTLILSAWLPSLVKAPAELQSAVQLLLGHTLIVRNRTAARRLITNYPVYTRVVTLRGEVFRGDGLIVAGKSSLNSTLSRPRQKREFAESITELSGRLEGLDQLIKNYQLIFLMHKENYPNKKNYRKLRKLNLNRRNLLLENRCLNLMPYDGDLSGRKIKNPNTRRIWQTWKEKLNFRRPWYPRLDTKDSLLQNDIRILSIQLSGLSLDEVQEQVAYWTTRLAVMEQSIKTVEARQSDLTPTA